MIIITQADTQRKILRSGFITNPMLHENISGHDRVGHISLTFWYTNYPEKSKDFLKKKLRFIHDLCRVIHLHTTLVVCIKFARILVNTSRNPLGIDKTKNIIT